jgi:tRNA threonylcarbamoyladenosine biosynthesis protein TsaB
MLLLSVDTSGKSGSLALARCRAGEGCDVMEVAALVGGTFSAQLVPQIAALLSKYGFSRQDIGGFAVATGPGSFTGLRVGLAAIKALAEVLDKPIAAVSLLEAVSESSTGAGEVFAVMDAGRGEAFAGRYAILPSGARMISEELVRIEDLCNTTDAQQIVTPDENLAGVLRRKGISVEVVERPRSDAIARLGWRKMQAGDTVPPEQLEANYIRRSDAEIFSKPQETP